jgi:hypothetical protein
MLVSYDPGPPCACDVERDARCPEAVRLLERMEQLRQQHPWRQEDAAAIEQATQQFGAHMLAARAYHRQRAHD